MILTIKNPEPIKREDCIPGNTCYFYDAGTDEIVQGQFSKARIDAGTDKISVFTAMPNVGTGHRIIPLDCAFLDPHDAEKALRTEMDRVRNGYKARMATVEDILVFAFDNVIARCADTDELAREAYRQRVMELFPNVRL